MKNPWLKRKEEAEFSSLMQKVCIAGHDDETFLMSVDSGTYISNTSIQNGYPDDDMHSLHQYSTGNWDMFYTSQFVQNETLDVMNKHSGFTSYSISHTPVLPGTVAGLVTFDETNAYYFTISSDGTFCYHDIGLSSNINFIPYSAKSSLDEVAGILKLEWHGKVSPEVEISYEYDMKGKTWKYFSL